MGGLREVSTRNAGVTATMPSYYSSRSQVETGSGPYCPNPVFRPRLPSYPSVGIFDGMFPLTVSHTRHSIKLCTWWQGGTALPYAPLPSSLWPRESSRLRAIR